jgi:caffeoyl-CoA O-methyltransferase
MLEELKEANEYIVGKIQEADKLILEMEAFAKEHNVPIVTKEVAKYLEFTLRTYKIKNVLEIGTAIGYSGTIMARECQKFGGKLTTIEIDEERYNEAKINFEKSGLDNIFLHLGDALEVIPKLEETYDFVFMDAAKGKYEDFFDLILPKMNKEGLIFIDNIMFRGYLYKEYPKRFKTIVRNLDKFINRLYEEHDFVLLPFGDGIGLVKISS